MLIWERDYYGDEFEEVMKDEYGEDWEQQFNKKWEEAKHKKKVEQIALNAKYQEILNNINKE